MCDTRSCHFFLNPINGLQAKDRNARVVFTFLLLCNFFIFSKEIKSKNNPGYPVFGSESRSGGGLQPAGSRITHPCNPGVPVTYHYLFTSKFQKIKITGKKFGVLHKLVVGYGATARGCRYLERGDGIMERPASQA